MSEATRELASYVIGIRSAIGNDEATRVDLEFDFDRKVAPLVEALEAALEWIDAVPDNTSLPAMPGVDRDWVNNTLDKWRAKP